MLLEFVFMDGNHVLSRQVMRLLTLGQRLREGLDWLGPLRAAPGLNRTLLRNSFAPTHLGYHFLRPGRL